MKNYWFYLEPYTFIFHSDETNKSVIYNTLNSTYLPIPESDFMVNLFERLDNASNGYCLKLTDEEIADNIQFKNFAKLIAKTFSGGLVEAVEGETKPFLFKPMLFLNVENRKAKEDEISFLGVRILENLNEVTLYLPGKGCPPKENTYYKQFLYPISWYDKNSMSTTDYLLLLLDLEKSGVNKVNIIGGDLSQNGILANLFPTLTHNNYKKVFYLSFDELDESCYNMFDKEQIELVIWVPPFPNKEMLETQMYRFTSKSIIWKLIVTSEEDIAVIESLTIPETTIVEMEPLFTGKNLSFFKKYVFNSLNDILEEPVSRKTIFRRQTLNENFFGKLTILPNGEVYANLNFEPIGIYPQLSLKELVFKELTQPTAWFYIRDKLEPCIHCVNRYLCPSVSNYELVISRSNLCTIVK